MKSSFDSFSIYFLTTRTAQIHTDQRYILLVYRLDKETHPDTLLPLGHRQHEVTRLAINLGFLALRRKGKLKFLEERQNYGLHFKNSANNVNQ